MQKWLKSRVMWLTALPTLVGIVAILETTATISGPLPTQRTSTLKIKTIAALIVTCSDRSPQSTALPLDASLRSEK